MKKRGFTLVELLAVIVIMAVIALIATPITISIINNSKENAHKRSIENYAREIEKAYLQAKMNRLNSIPNTISGLKEAGLIKVSGENVVCDDNYTANEDGIELTNCYVSEKNNPEKQKSKHKYDYKNGKLIKLDNDENNSSEESNNKEYTIGEEITFKNEKYNVIGQGSDYVTLLKQQPLTVDEVNTYGGVGTANNHVNMYNADSSDSYYHQAYDWYEWNHSNHSGGMVYYSSADCGWGNDSNYTDSGCITDYNLSDIKHVVDNWADAKFNNELETVDGYAARLAQKEELSPIGWPGCSSSANSCDKENITPNWIYAPNNEYWYWTMSQWNSSPSLIWTVNDNGYLGNRVINSDYTGAVRPVINLKKSAIK